MRWRLLIVVAMLTGSQVMRAAPPPTPVLVELFTSEGCSDCPAADTLLDTLVASQPIAGAQIIGVGHHVDYWDRLGWKDRFSSPAVTNRQRLYQARFGTESIYTPQMVVDGRAEFVGSDAAAATKAIERTLTARHGVMTIQTLELPRPVAKGDQRIEAAFRVGVSVADLPPVASGDRADIIMLVTESGLRTAVTRGENHGRTLSHGPVVRYIATIGHLAEHASTAPPTYVDITLPADWQLDHLAFVAFVQEARDRTILAAASVPVRAARP